MQSRFILSRNSRANYSPCRRTRMCTEARRVCVRLHVRAMIEERGSENELRFAKPSFAARPMRLDPSHFYHPGLATTDESRIGCGGMNERGRWRRRGWPRRARKTERRVGSLLRPFARPFASPCAPRPSFAAPTSRQLWACSFLRGSTTSRLGATHAEASSGSHATPVSRLPKAVPNIVARRLACTLPPPSLRARTNPIGVSCRLSLKFTSGDPSRPLASPTDHRHRPRPTRKTLRENLAPASTTRENCIVAL